MKIFDNDVLCHKKREREKRSNIRHSKKESVKQKFYIPQK